MGKKALELVLSSFLYVTELRNAVESLWTSWR